MFGERTAARDVKRYREKGLSKPTLLLLDALRAEGVERASVLDIGGGIGAIQLELLDAGAATATSVDASAAYLRAARAEAERRGHAEHISQHAGDFVELAEGIEPADVVTLDRVLCCYPDVERLVSRSAERARRVYGLVYPRDTWWTRLAFVAFNVGLRVIRRPFRVYIHPSAAVDAAVRETGLARRLRRPVGPLWQVVVYTHRR